MKKGQEFYNLLSEEERKEFDMEYELCDGATGDSIVDMMMNLLPPELVESMKHLKPKRTSLEKQLDANFDSFERFVTGSFIFSKTRLGEFYWRNIIDKYEGREPSPAEDLFQTTLRQYRRYLTEESIDPQTSPIPHDILKRKLQMTVLVAISHMFHDEDTDRQEVERMMDELIPSIMKYVDYLYDTEFGKGKTTNLPG